MSITRIYWQGQPMNERAAMELLAIEAEAIDCPAMVWMDIWAQKDRCEHARDKLYELSGFRMEICIVQ